MRHSVGMEQFICRKLDSNISTVNLVNMIVWINLVVRAANWGKLVKEKSLESWGSRDSRDGDVTDQIREMTIAEEGCPTDGDSGAAVTSEEGAAVTSEEGADSKPSETNGGTI